MFGGVLSVRIKLNYTISEALSTTVPIIKIQKYLTTADMERFAGLNIHGFSLIKFFAVILSQCIGHQCSLLTAKIHAKSFTVSSKL